MRRKERLGTKSIAKWRVNLTPNPTILGTYARSTSVKVPKSNYLLNLSISYVLLNHWLLLRRALA